MYLVGILSLICWWPQVNASRVYYSRLDSAHCLAHSMKIYDVTNIGM